MALDPHVDIIDGSYRILYGDGPPTAAGTGAAPYVLGDVILNVLGLTPGDPTHFRCVTAGDPGTWETVSSVLQQSFTLTNTQTKALNSAPTTILAAQGAGSLIEVVSVIFENVFLTAAFANGGAIALYYGNDSTGVLASATVAATFLTSPAASQSIMVAGALASNLSSAVLNTKLVLACATADFITGAGSLKVRVNYRVHFGL
jgi:hypothetical protein